MPFRDGNGGVPLHSPPFKIATSWSNGFWMKNIVELRLSDMSRSSRVFAIELRYEFWCRNFGSGLSGIVFTAISLLLNEVLESSLVPMTVEYFLYLGGTKGDTKKRERKDGTRIETDGKIPRDEES